MSKEVRKDGGYTGSVEIKDPKAFKAPQVPSGVMYFTRPIAPSFARTLNDDEVGRAQAPGPITIRGGARGPESGVVPDRILRNFYYVELDGERIQVDRQSFEKVCRRLGEVP